MMQHPHIPLRQPAEPRPRTPPPARPTGDTSGDTRGETCGETCGEGGQPQEHLAELAIAVEKIAPLQARVIAASVARPPILCVVNPDAADLAEDITCRTDGGRLLFYWSWAEPIGPVTDVDAAALAIALLLISAPGHA